MQRLLSVLVLGLACTLGLGTVGCSKKDKDKADTAKADTGKADTGKMDTGKTDSGKNAGIVVYEYPTEVLVLKQGEKKTFDVTRKGKSLKASELNITSSDPSVTVEGGSFKDEDKTATVTIMTTKDTPAKEHTLTIKSGDKTETVNIRVVKGIAEVVPPVAKATEYKVALEAVTLKQGGSKDVTITRTGKGLKDEDLVVSSSDPKLSVKGGMFKGDAKETTLTIQADAKAKTGEQTITIKAGDKTISTIKVNVEKAGKGASNVRPQGDAAAALGRDAFQVEASTVSRRETAWFTREL